MLSGPAFNHCEVLSSLNVSVPRSPARIVEVRSHISRRPTP
jgi:hypothetical protein